MQHNQGEVFEILLLAVSEELDGFSKVLAYCVLCNLSRKGKEAKKLFKCHKVYEKMQDFIFEEKDILTNASAGLLGWTATRKTFACLVHFLRELRSLSTTIPT